MQSSVRPALLLSFTMPSIQELPRELREQIWSRVCEKETPPSIPHSIYDLLRTSRQFRFELAPHLYESVTLCLHRPRNVLHWIHTIGTYNSSCVRRLVLRFCALDSDVGKKNHDEALDVWSASFNVMPNLDYLVYHYEPSKPYDPHWYSSYKVTLLPNLDYAWKMATPVKLPKKGILNADNYDDDVFEGLSTSSRHFTHAVLAIHEPMPEMNATSFIKLLGMNSALTLPHNITCLPQGFLADHGLHLTRTYTMIEEPSQQSAALTYCRSNPLVPNSKPNLPLIFSNLPWLLYLRLGCSDVDSSFLAFLPKGIQTLDVTFKDRNPTKVASNLKRMRDRCQKLYTLAITVSPLHDLCDLPDGGRPIDQHSTGEANKSEWEPFWEALRFVQSTGVKVWEGEGPGYNKRRTV